ncbi:glycine-rich cell wall structural protein 1-like [Nymphaea colorata]|uniref:glycine-rich cell wall structural protein 1-like n=1 Tax=Nymphaea colorata TaxID=210225 RepID=UPI00129E6D16|nr:glycine-rich cell wall structural protein 1-like [Nymphaea colorata]
MMQSGINGGSSGLRSAEAEGGAWQRAPRTGNGVGRQRRWSDVGIDGGVGVGRGISRDVGIGHRRSLHRRRNSGGHGHGGAVAAVVEAMSRRGDNGGGGGSDGDDGSGGRQGQWSEAAPTIATAKVLCSDRKESP